MTRRWAILLAALAVAGCDTGPPPPASGDGAATSAAPAPAPAPAPAAGAMPAGLTEVTLPQGLAFGVPQGWETQQPKSNMRAAQYGLPRAEGDTTDAECVVFFFGATQGGSVEDNIQRWIGQMSPAAGAEPVRTTFETNGCTVYTLDVEGDYGGGPGGGGPSAGARMLAAIVVTSGGKFFFKCLGPAATVGAQAPAFQALCRSVRFEQR